MRLALVLAALLAPALAALAAPVQPQEDVAVVARLPTPRMGTAAVWDGQQAYVFGGRGYGADPPRYDDIVRFTPSTGEVRVMAARLPSARAHLAAVWTGSAAYLFGGDRDGQQVVRYDPARDVVEVMGAAMKPMWDASAVWDGRFAYVFGGRSSSNPLSRSDAILRYDPATDAVEVMGARLPQAAFGTSAVWDGRVAYVFGGYGNDGHQVVRVDPRTHTAEVLPARLPEQRWGTSATWDGTAAHVFAGCCGYRGENWVERDTVYRFDPSAMRVGELAARFPSAREATSAVFAGGASYVFGGGQVWGEVGNGPSVTDEVVRFTP